MLLAFDPIQPRTIEAVSEIIHYEATEAQRKAALARASAYLAHLSPEKKLAIKKQKVGYIAVPVPRSEKTSAKAKAVVMLVKIQPETKEEAKPKTNAETKTPPTGKEHANTELFTRSLINNDAYELPIVPTAGTTQKFDTITAQYIGSSE